MTVFDVINSDDLMSIKTRPLKIDIRNVNSKSLEPEKKLKFNFFVTHEDKIFSTY